MNSASSLRKLVTSLPLHRPVVLHSDDTLEQAALAMRANNIGSVLVNDRAGRLIGILTDRDLAFAYTFDKVSPADTIGAALRGGKFVFVTDDATLEDVIQVMRQEGIRRVPVVHQGSRHRDRCVGMITLDDLIRADLIERTDEQAILDSQLDVPVLPSGGRNSMRAAFRYQDRRQQSYFRFLSKISRDTGLSRGEARDLTLYMMTAILRRISAEEGKDLLSQLPYMLQVELLPEISEPDRHFGLMELQREISDRFNLSPEEARYLLSRFWFSLEDVVSAGELRDVEAQLPREMVRALHEAR